MSDAMQAEQLEWGGLAMRGSIPTPLVAIVGTRTPTTEAAEAAFAVARVLAAAGVGVVSGLALGIDAAAHRGCLAGGGRTVAVLGHGLAAPVYPPQHREMAAIIAAHGALVSPFEDEVPVGRNTLLARNYWIAHLARAVWVVQTGMPGGALAAAAHARRQNIPVLTTVWPEAHWTPGCQSLLQHGAESVNLLTAAARLEQLATQKQPKAQGAFTL